MDFFYDPFVNFKCQHFRFMDLQRNEARKTQVSLKHLHLCFEDEKKSYGFEMTVNDDRISFFG